MDNIQAIYDDESHAGDIDLRCEVLSWDSIHAFDWEAKVPNTTVDVLRGVQVGLAKDSKGARLLLIRFVDTQLECVPPSGGAWYDWTSNQPSVWAIGLRATSIRSLERLLTGNPLDAEARVIHREPWIEHATWYAEAKWVVENQSLIGVEISLRASQETVAQIHVVHFMTKGHYFRKTTVKDVSPDVEHQVADAYLKAVSSNPLPPEVNQGPTPLVELATEKVPICTFYLTEGESPLELEINGSGGTTDMFQAYMKKDDLFQSLVSGKITIRNPSTEDHYIQKVTTYVSFSGGHYVECLDTDETKGSVIGNYRGSMLVHGKKHSDVSWQTASTSLTVPAKSFQDICVKAIWTVPNATAHSGQPFNMRLHKSLTQPVTVKAVFIDDRNLTKTVYWDYSDDPLENRTINSYQNLLADEREMQRLGLKRGIGPDDLCDIWLQMDDPETLKRTYLVVTHKKENPTEWSVRAEDTDGSFPCSYSLIKPTSFHRMVYDAIKKRAQNQELDMSSTWCRSSKKCKLSLLLDLDNAVIYGLTASIQIGDRIVTKSMYLDQILVRAKSSL